jgi:hypothetical protein
LKTGQRLAPQRIITMMLPDTAGSCNPSATV